MLSFLQRGLLQNKKKLDLRGPLSRTTLFSSRTLSAPFVLGLETKVHGNGAPRHTAALRGCLSLIRLGSTYRVRVSVADGKGSC